MVLECFPSLQLLVACCPHPLVAPADLHGCPEAFLHQGATCCMPNVVRTMFKALGTLSPEDLLPQIPAEDSYYKTLIAIGGLMRTYVIDSDHQLMEAWKLYALAMARVAIMEVDPIKDDFLRMQHVEDSQFLLQKAVHSSRKLLRAMFRLESFHIFLLGHTAAAHRVKMQDLSFEFIRPNFQPALELYEIGMNTFDLLAFSIIPNLEAMIRKPQGRGFSLKQSQRKLNQTAEEVALLAVSLGNWAKTGFLTIWSILQQRSSPLRIFILGDPPGLLEWQKAATELSEQEDHEMLKGVSFEYIDFEKHPKFIEYLQQHPHQDCSFGAAGKAILARAVCHLVLPPQISKIISMDLGDVLVFDDLRSLWQQFQHMEDHHVLAASHAVALSHINAGVVLYHVERMRLVGFERLALRAVEDMQRWKADRDNWRRHKTAQHSSFQNTTDSWFKCSQEPRHKQPCKLTRLQSYHYFSSSEKFSVPQEKLQS